MSVVDQRPGFGAVDREATRTDRKEGGSRAFRVALASPDLEVDQTRRFGDAAQAAQNDISPFDSYYDIALYFVLTPR